MKGIKLTIVLLYLTCVAVAQTNILPPVKIGTEPPPSSSILDVFSTSKGVLIPRMSKEQRDAIPSPATSLLIYQNNSSPGFYFYTGTAWKSITADSSWLLHGNSGTSSANAFLGTTDAAPLKFKVNNQLSGLIDQVTTSIGYRAGVSNLGMKNTFIGVGSGTASSSGNENTFVGYNSGSFNTTASNCTIIGSEAGFINQGGGNTFIGNQSGFSNLGANNNTFLGLYTGFSNTVGSSNVFIGTQAGYSNLSGEGSTLIGFQSGVFNTLGGQTFVGYQAGFHNLTGGSNTFLGYQSGMSNTTGDNNTAIGKSALATNAEGAFNTANGMNALFQNTTGNQNTAIGYSAMYANTTGSFNTAVGNNAMGVNGSSGQNNTAIGSNALEHNNSDNNTATGMKALLNNSSGSDNTANGVEALNSNVDGIGNTAIGRSALNSNNSNNNTSVGLQSMFFTTNGAENTAIGYKALSANTIGSFNTALGSGSGTTDGEFSNTTAVGAYAKTTASNQITIGNDMITSIGGVTNWTFTSDGRVKKNVKRNVPGLTFIKKLQPVTFNLDLDAMDRITEIPRTQDDKLIAFNKEQTASRNAKQQIVYTGFIAQDVEIAAKELHFDFSGVDAAQNSHDLYGLRYAEFVVPLVKAVQELDSTNTSKNDQIVALQATVDALQKQLDKLQGDFLQLGRSLAECVPNCKIIMNSETSGSELPKLEQNIPNPFDQNTIIRFYLPKTAVQSVIKIYSLNGVELKSFNITHAGSGEISIDGKSLAPGAYIYALVIDGQAIDTKNMILTK